MLLTIVFLTSFILELSLCWVVFYASLGSDLTNKLIRQKFYLFNILLALWTVSQGAFSWTNNIAIWNMIFRVSSSLAIIFGFSYLLFAKSLIEEKISKLAILSNSFLTLLALILVIFFDIGSAVIVSGKLDIRINPLLDGIVTVIPIIMFFYGIYLLEAFARKNINSKPERSKQAKYLSRGMISVVTIIYICNYVLSSVTGVTNILVALATLIFVFIVGFSVFSLKLFDFSKFSYKALAYIATLTVIFAIYTTIAIFAAKYILGIHLDTKSELILAIFSAITALIFQPLKRFFDKVTNRVFYRDAYDSQEFLNSVNTKIVNEIDLYALLNKTAEVIANNIKAGFCSFYIDEKASIDFHIAGTDTKIFAQKGWDELDAIIDESSTKIYAGIEQSDEKVIEQMNKLGIDVIVKMISQDQHVGYLVIGQKKSGGAITNQDVQILEIIADEVAIAVQNSLRFEEIAHFNITLQKKIELATAELQKTNEKLKALDEAKDEFISMASHQLRTPLTSVKGYISMLLEGDAGKISDQQKTFLNQAFMSSQRMVYLIADLLNVSRLKTGKFVIDAKPTYLPDVVETELAQLIDTATSRGLEIIFNKPKDFPTLNLDETKTRQVIMNFVDNAIYYTPKGGKITVKLEATDKSVELTVNDTGLGVPKADQHHLFTKFYRAGNARKARPDGTGLGLFMAKKVIVDEGGAIVFRSVEGKGSTFGFSFPRAKLEVEKA